MATNTVRPWLMMTVRKYRHLFTEIVILSVTAQGLLLLTPIVLQVVIDKIVVYRASTTLVVLIISYGVACLLEIILAFCRTYLLSSVVTRIDVELLARLFHHLIQLPMSYFGGRDVGTITARIKELENIRGTLTHGTITALIEAFFACIFVVLMLYYSVFLCVIQFCAIPLYVGASLIFTPITRRRLRERFRRTAETQAFLVETISGIETIKCAAIEPRIEDEYGEKVAGLAQCTYSASEISNLSMQVGTLINRGVQTLIFYFGATMAIAGDLSVGQFIAFNMFSRQLSQPILKLIQTWQDLQQVKTTMDRLADIIDTKKEEGLYEQRSHLESCDGNIEFQRVGFRYRSRGKYVIQNISLTIPQGQVLGVIGRSGSGKSTIARLLLRLYIPENGRVLLDGENIATMDPVWLRKQIGIVSQETFLFNKTVRDNIALNQPDMPIEQVVAAAKTAEAHEFIISLPKSYDTMLGERGNILSGGQRQRLALARAIATNPRILILDEATSALDFETERQIQANLRKIAQGRTVIIISHRFVAVASVDRVITISDGQIVEDGTPEQLLAAAGWYAQLYQNQYRRQKTLEPLELIAAQ